MTITILGKFDFKNNTISNADILPIFTALENSIYTIRTKITNETLTLSAYPLGHILAPTSDKTYGIVSGKVYKFEQITTKNNKLGLKFNIQVAKKVYVNCYAYTTVFNRIDQLVKKFPDAINCVNVTGLFSTYNTSSGKLSMKVLVNTFDILSWGTVKTIDPEPLELPKASESPETDWNTIPF